MRRLDQIAGSKPVEKNLRIQTRSLTTCLQDWSFCPHWSIRRKTGPGNDL